MLRFLQNEQLPIPAVLPDSVQKARFAESVEKLTSLDLSQVWDEMVEWFIWTAIKLVIALTIFYLGRWILRRLMAVIDRVLTARDVEQSLHKFLLTATKVVGLVVIFLTIVSILGFDSTSFVAMLASAGLAIGMALSGTLQNFAGGVMILVQRPYKIGDFIETDLASGTVVDIRLFSTVLHTTDKKTIYIPNNTISTGVVINYSTSTTRRCSWKVSVSYGDNYDTIRESMLEIIRRDERVLATPEPCVRIDALADSAVIIEARAWVENEDFWDVYDSITERFYKELPEHGANFPFPQLDVNIKREN
ncbi:MAG: mechanosensitive ion channel [Alistipes sp.]|nr:mechanosensitive ion channel [Alistipes sp.]